VPEKRHKKVKESWIKAGLKQTGLLFAYSNKVKHITVPLVRENSKKALVLCKEQPYVVTNFFAHTFCVPICSYCRRFGNNWLWDNRQTC
jgi:hypothetical protein